MESRLPLTNFLAAIRSLSSEIHEPKNHFTEYQKEVLNQHIDNLLESYSLVEGFRQDLEKKAYALANTISNNGLYIVSGNAL